MRPLREVFREKRAAGQPVISFEFFPPKTPEGDASLLERTIPGLKAFRPDYCSVTYGAGGSTRDKSLMIVDRIQKEHGLTALAHLTCVNATREEIGEVLAEAQALGVKNILALRGDPPAGSDVFTKTEGGFEYSYELVEYLRDLGDFSIGVAGFPEGHIACKEGKHVDWDRLKHKIDCGADFVITQLFFDNADFYEFRDHLTKQLGVKVPLVPGILPVLSAGQAKRFTGLCGARIPEPMLQRLNELTDDDAGAAEFGVEHATAQCRDLLANGVVGIHFYCLNKLPSCAAVLRNLNLDGHTGD
ncbi:MAG TPA: methylenetetrahydrofolate reductase [NAD(P)H] [Verrucomicrobiales bacterium]|nr:methylenetetrahydrofolate reductase [NAD(P)H] [Verrucomicrobiales bacterium]